MDDERRARAILNATSRPGDGRASEVIAEFGAIDTLESLRASPSSSRWASRVQALNADHMFAVARHYGIRFIIPGDDEWPSSLDDLAHCVPATGDAGMPIGLWVRGAPLNEWCASSAAIVGARASTAYGEGVASRCAGELSTHHSFPMTIISGGALGIDAAAHQGALAAGGRTIGVYAGGLDSAYPASNHALFEQLCSEHCVVSESAPGAHPSRPGFLARNRLIAALAQGTIVVEAALRSGARNTASWAHALGKPVGAVPGSVHGDSSRGCHDMIRNGQANLVCDSDDMRALILPVGAIPDTESPDTSRPLDGLRSDLLEVREAMPARRGCTIAHLHAVTGIPMSELAGRLTELEILGWVRMTPTGWKLATRDRQPRLV